MSISQGRGIDGVDLTEPTYDVVPEADHPQVQAFADLWHGKRGTRVIPRRDDFDIEDLGPWMGFVIIMDVIDGGADFRYRLIGTGITTFLRRDYSGRTVMESDYGDARAKIVDTFRKPVQVLAPVFRSGFVGWAVDKSWRTYHSVHCPISREGDIPEMTIGVLVFGDDRVVGPNGSKWEVDPADR